MPHWKVSVLCYTYSHQPAPMDATQSIRNYAIDTAADMFHFPLAHNMYQVTASGWGAVVQLPLTTK
jgi:hypothetical protein